MIRFSKQIIIQFRCADKNDQHNFCQAMTLSVYHNVITIGNFITIGL